MAQERFLDGPLTDILAQWRHYFALLAPRAGDVIVDIGCDTGDADRLLAADYPEIEQVVAIEADARRYHRALERWQAGGADPRVTFRQADARDLPFAEDTFDRAICAEMLEFVVPPDKALAELRRVLKPGGVAIVVHTDWETQMFATRDRRRARRAVQAFAGEGQGADLGRRLDHLCRRAGFRDVEPSVYTVLNTEWRDTLVAPRVVALMKEWLKDSPDFGSDDLTAWAADLEAAVAEDSFCYAVNRFVCRCVKEKPAV